MSWHNKYSYFHRKEAPADSPNREENSLKHLGATRTADQQKYYDQLVRNNPDIMQNKQNITELPPGSILLYNITPEEFFAQMKVMVKEILQQDQLLTKEGAMKLVGVSAAKLKKAIDEGIVKPQLVKGRTKAMYLESEVLKIKPHHRPSAEGEGDKPMKALKT